MNPRVQQELLAGLYRQMQPLLIALGAGSGVLVLAALMLSQGRAWAIPWALSHLAIIGVWVTADLLWFRRRAEPPLVTWSRWATVFATASGAMWGLAAIVFFEPNDLIGTALLVTFFAGISVVCVAAFSANYAMLLAVIFTASAPLCVMSLTSGSKPLIYIGLGQLAYLGLILVASNRHHHSLRRAAELRFDVEDLAERLRLEKERVERAYVEKSQFLASASHDLRQPLHAQSLLIELLEAKVQDPEQRAFLSRIQASGRSLKSLLDALLELSRIDAHALKVQPSHFSLSELFNELVLEHHEAAQRKGLKLDGRSTNQTIHGDRELISRVLRNLLSNAIRHTDAGTITLEARGTAVHVIDTGPGITKEDQQQIFEPFFRGLGLSIVRGLCEAMKVPLTLNSSPKGTQFIVELEAGKPELVKVEPLETPQLTTPLTGRRVLVLDDEEHVRTGTAALLSSWDCEPVCAATLPEALQHATDGRLDGVVCDYRLGATLGTHALVELEQRAGARLPAVFVTAETSPELLAELRASGRPLLLKPVAPGKLRAALSSVLV